MCFVTSDLQVIAGLEAGARQYRDLIDRTGLARSTISKSVSRLSERGIVERDQSGRTVTVRPQPTSVVDEMATVRESAPQLDLQEFLTVSRLRVVWFLTAPRTPSEIARFSDVDEPRVRQILTALQKRQVATETGGQVRLRSKYEPLQSLAECVFNLFYAAEIDSMYRSPTVIWTAPHEALFTAPSAGGCESLDGTVTETGLDQFIRWGLEFRSSSSPVYYYSELPDTGTLATTDVIVHTLCRRVDNRRVEYSALLVAEAVVDGDFVHEQFLELTDHYGVREVGEYLAALVVASAESAEPGRRHRSVRRTDAATARSERDRSTPAHEWLPSPARVRDTAVQYGVDISAASEKLKDAIDGEALKQVRE